MLFILQAPTVVGVGGVLKKEHLVFERKGLLQNFDAAEGYELL